MHAAQIREHGGLPGLRDEGALESALARPQQKWHYEKPGLPVLAAAYGYGLCRSHPFRDGNKRVAFVTMLVFLELNNQSVDATDTEIVTLMTALAAGGVSEADLAAWLEKRIRHIRRNRL